MLTGRVRTWRSSKYNPYPYWPCAVKDDISEENHEEVL
jgi:hypothetical protein